MKHINNYYLKLDDDELRLIRCVLVESSFPNQEEKDMSLSIIDRIESKIPGFNREDPIDKFHKTIKYYEQN